MAHILALLTLLALPSLAAANVVISEVLADPPSGLAGDANGDGVRNGYEDEFIELYNTGSEAVNIGDWRLGDSSSLDKHFNSQPARSFNPARLSSSSAAASRRDSPSPSIPTTEKSAATA